MPAMKKSGAFLSEKGPLGMRNCGCYLGRLPSGKVDSFQLLLVRFDFFAFFLFLNFFEFFHFYF